MVDKLVNIPNDDTQNYPFCLIKPFIEPTNQYSLKFSKLLGQQIRKRFYFGDQYNKPLTDIVLFFSPLCGEPVLGAWNDNLKGIS